MAAFSSIALATALLASTTFAAVQAEEQADEAERESQLTRFEANKKEGDLQARKAGADKQAAGLQQRAMAGGGLGARRGSNVFTSPLGVTGNPLGAGKQAIGL